jgi:fructose-specific phosphotransferase system IIA component
MNKLGIKSDKSYFDYHKGEEYNIDLPSYNLASLVITQLIATMEKEGFYIVEHEKENNASSYLMRYKGRYMLVSLNTSKISITTELNDLTYGKQLIYETLLDLDHSVSSIREVVEPSKMRDIVKEVSNDNKQTAITITKHLNKNLITTNLKSTTKENIIKELLSIAANQGYIKLYDEVLDSILAREKSMSTGFENGIAIPHTRSNTIEKIILIIGIKKDGIDFDSIDGKPTTIFFMIISPVAEAEPHIQLLAEISKLSRDKEKINDILNASSARSIISIIKRR